MDSIKKKSLLLSEYQDVASVGVCYSGARPARLHGVGGSFDRCGSRR